MGTWLGLNPTQFLAIGLGLFALTGMMTVLQMRTDIDSLLAQTAGKFSAADTDVLKPVAQPESSSPAPDPLMDALEMEESLLIRQITNGQAHFSSTDIRWGTFWDQFAPLLLDNGDAGQIYRHIVSILRQGVEDFCDVPSETVSRIRLQLQSLGLIDVRSKEDEYLPGYWSVTAEGKEAFQKFKQRQYRLRAVAKANQENTISRLP